MAATPTSSSCWGCFPWRQSQQESSSPATTLDRPSLPRYPVTQTPANRFSYPTGIERHLARIHTGAENRKSFPPCQASDSDSGLGRTITAETSEESFAGATAAPRPTDAVRDFDDGGLAQEMALLRVELEIVRWECDSIIRQKRKDGSWSRRRRVLDWMQRHDSSDTSYDPSTVSSTSSALRPSSPSPSSSVEDCGPQSSFRPSHSRPSYVRSQSMTIACPKGTSRDHKRCSSASPVRRKAPVARSYRLCWTISDKQPSSSPFRPRCRSNPVARNSCPPALPSSRTAGEISDLCRRPRYEKQQSCFPTQSIPECPIQLSRPSRTLQSIPQEEEPLEEPRRWFGDLSTEPCLQPDHLCAFHSPERIKSPSRLLPVLECCGGANLDVDFELLTAELCPRRSNARSSPSRGALPKKSRKQMRRERAVQLARSRADTTTSTDSDATLQTGGCQACRARRRAEQTDNTL